MKKAGEEEKAIAIFEGHYHQGIPAITIIVNVGLSNCPTNIPIMPNLALVFNRQGDWEDAIYGSQKQILFSLSQYYWGHCTST